MNEFIEKASDDEYFNDIGISNIKESFVKSFNNYNKNLNINDLVFIKLYDVIAIFTYNDKGSSPHDRFPSFMFYIVDDDAWGTILHEVLNTTTTSKYAELMNESSPSIEYVLYPFVNDTDMDTVSICNEDLTDMTGAIEVREARTFDSLDDGARTFEPLDYGYVYSLPDGYQLCINNSYILKKDGQFVSGFIDESCNFQVGDCTNQVHILNNGNILVYNYGDVMNAVIIHFT